MLYCSVLKAGRTTAIAYSIEILVCAIPASLQNIENPARKDIGQSPRDSLQVSTASDVARYLYWCNHLIGGFNECRGQLHKDETADGQGFAVI